MFVQTAADTRLRLGMNRLGLTLRLRILVRLRLGAHVYRKTSNKPSGGLFFNRSDMEEYIGIRFLKMKSLILNDEK